MFFFDEAYLLFKSASILLFRKNRTNDRINGEINSFSKE
ncbi:hypothetical protein [Candidatus Coxiella mudrowiae]|nr:hypothetical protein [Candidatus Coxiella mudrowiae]